MKKITFKVSDAETKNISIIAKEINAISCRIQFDFEQKIIVAEGMNSDQLIDKVIDLINNYYTIVTMEIDNTNNIEKVEEKDKIQLCRRWGEELNTRVDKLLKSINYAIKERKVDEEKIVNHIKSASGEISRAYYDEQKLEFKVGDIVDCQYGTHYLGENEGGHVYSIVCDISKNGMAYVVPIYKCFEEQSADCMIVTVNKDVVLYKQAKYMQGIAVLELAQYVNSKRFNTVVGMVNPEFFKELLNNLAVKYNFTKANTKVEKEPAAAKKDNKKVANKKHITKKETIILETIKTAVDKLDPSIPAQEQIVSFLENIGMSKNEKVVKNAFIIACEVKKVTYENVINKLCRKHPTTETTELNAIMQRTFKKWLEKYPELIEKCYNVSFMDLLKVFAYIMNQ